MSLRMFAMIPVLALPLTLVACGQQTAMTTAFQQNTSAACTGAAMPQQFIVKKYDGSIEVVRAESEDAFIGGYMKRNSANIQYAEHDYQVRIPKPVSATSADNTATVADNWGVIKVEADKLWAQNQRGGQVVVAVVDTGVDITHPQLQQQIFTNPGEYGPDGKGGRKESNGIDDDGNGYVDDYSGWDFTLNQPLKGDNQYHGTHVTGIIAAYHTDTVAQSATYVQGVAPAAKILPLAFLDNTGSGSMSNAVLAIQYAVARGAHVINASWGGPDCSVTLRDEIASLEAQNVAFVTAAGNDSLNIDNSPEYPAALNLAAQLTVGASGDHDYMDYYSNYGQKAVHIFAPGSNIVSTLPQNSIGPLTGTSMATPFVTGAMALLWGAVPQATITQIRLALYNSAVRNAEYLNASEGRMDLGTALSELQKIIGN